MQKSEVDFKNNVTDQVTEWLGENYIGRTNKKSGNKVFMSQDGQRKMRFDIAYSHGDKPHIHLEILENGEWKDAVPGIHRIYPKK